MKWARPVGVGGAGLEVLLYALDRLDVDLPTVVLRSLVVIGGLMILYGVVGTVTGNRRENEAPHATSDSRGSSGTTVGSIGDIKAKRDVIIGNVGRGGTEDQATPEPLDLEVETLAPTRVSSWDNHWRITLRVTNRGTRPVKVSAFLLSPIGGIDERDVGDFNLHWDTTNENFTTLLPGKPERLYPARINDRHRQVIFLGPGKPFGKPRDHHHNPKKVTDSPVRGTLRFTTIGGDCVQRHFEIHLDKDNTPTPQVAEPEPC